MAKSTTIIPSYIKQKNHIYAEDRVWLAIYSVVAQKVSDKT